jgi:hypothetical protein
METHCDVHTPEPRSIAAPHCMFRACVKTSGTTATRLKGTQNDIGGFTQ